ncbi:sigma 54-interacting transcriptional regulator [Cytobacillus sp. Hm23]
MEKEVFLIEIRQITSYQFIQIKPTSSVRDVLQAFLHFRQDIACVLSNKKFIGIVTKYSLYRCLLNSGDLAKEITPYIKKNVVTLNENDNVYYAKDLLVQENVGHAIVLNDQQRVVGVLTKSELIRGLISESQSLTDRLNLLINNLEESVISVNLHLTITSVNTPATSILNYDKTQLINHSIEEISPTVTHYLKTAIKSKSTIKHKQLLIGTTSVIASFIPLVQWETITGGMVVLKDITDYEQVAKNLVSTKQNTNYFEHIISRSEKMEDLKQQALIAAQSFSTILITGKSGTGKELLADGIHLSSGRKGNFIKINCAAIPEELLEAEIFGYTSGAFTGAKRGGKPGKFELAHEGTLFLDEIGDMPLSLQAKLLRVLQEREFERVGGTKTIKVDVRIIAATNKNLIELITKGNFREDLYYRINVIQLQIPPLKERMEDIPLLCNHFIEKFNGKTKRAIIGISNGGIEKLQQYDWPGNVRQLENIIERAYHFTNTKWIEPLHIQFEELTHEPQQTQPTFHTFNNGYLTNQKNLLKESEKSLIIQALIQTNGNRTKAAHLLGISRSTLYEKIKNYAIKEQTHYI